MIQLRVYGGDGCEPKEEELMYIVVVGNVFLAQWQMLLKVKKWR